MVGKFAILTNLFFLTSVTPCTCTDTIKNNHNYTVQIIYFFRRGLNYIYNLIGLHTIIHLSPKFKN